MTEPSLTARRVAQRRAAHQLLDVPIVHQDPLALRMLGATRPEARTAIAAREQGRLARTLRAFLAARARVAEDTLASCVDAGVSQYVIIGAGLDTFAYRNPYGDRVRVFEMDHPASQVWKRERLAEAGIDPDGLVRFVEADLASADVREALGRAGWDPGVPTLCAWLGVTMYLDAAAVFRVLDGVAHCAAGSAIVFDYALAPELLGPVERLVFDEFAARVAAAGEPWVSTFAPDDLRQRLEAAGFTAVDDLGPDALNARYFTGRADGMRVGSLAHVMVAGV